MILSTTNDAQIFILVHCFNSPTCNLRMEFLDLEAGHSSEGSPDDYFAEREDDEGPSSFIDYEEHPWTPTFYRQLARSATPDADASTSPRATSTASSRSISVPDATSDGSSTTPPPRMSPTWIPTSTESAPTVSSPTSAPASSKTSSTRRARSTNFAKPMVEMPSSSCADTTPNPTWRLECRTLFLTWPQNSTPKETVLERIKTKFGSRLSWAVVAQEAHQDGAPHLHACLLLRDKYRSRLLHDLCELAEAHGNYQAARNTHQVLTYITKSDPSPATEGIDVAAQLSKKNGRASQMAFLLQSGAESEDLFLEDPGFMLQNLSKVEAFKTAWTLILKRKRRSSAPLSFQLLAGGVEAGAVVTWLQDNLRTQRPFKSPQLYLWSAPNMGKTSLIRTLEEVLSVYWATLEGTDDDLYEDGVYDLAVFDEFYGQRKLTWMNSFLQGAPMCVHRRYHSTMKYENIPCIILSNHSPQDCYKNVPEEGRAAFLARLFVVEIRSFIQIKIQ